MYGKLDIFQMAQGLATHASARQNAIATNVANADTPGYRARDIVPFAQAYQSDPTDTGLRTTRAGHMSGTASAGQTFQQIDRPGPASPNGNTVALETEMMKAAEVRLDHEMALSIYQTSLGILRTSLGRGR